MGKTKISWTDVTWNPVRGCRRVSPGCEHCYAEQVAGRFCGPGQAYEGLAVRKLRVIDNDEQRSVGRWTGKVRFVAEHLGDPLRWRSPRRVFVNSMSDLFHEDLTNEQIAAVFGVMAAAPRHTFQVLTKRPARMREWFRWIGGGEPEVDLVRLHAQDVLGTLHPALGKNAASWPLPNVWIGVSVEDQERADGRIPMLLQTPAAVRFLSCEPLLEEVNIAAHLLQVVGVDWVIAGCESGFGMRPCNVGWLRSLRDQCRGAEVPFFLKQAVELSYTRSVYPSARAAKVTEHVVASGPGAKKRGGGIIELPYLDGVQHAAFPEVRP